MEQIGVTFDDDTLERLDSYALDRHDGDRDAAVRTLLDGWIDQVR